MYLRCEEKNCSLAALTIVRGFDLQFHTKRQFLIQKMILHELELNIHEISKACVKFKKSDSLFGAIWGKLLCDPAKP